MSKLDDLIAELCLEGVEFKLLGEIAHYSRDRTSVANIDYTNYVTV